MKNIKKLLLLVIASFSTNNFAMTGRNAQKMTQNAVKAINYQQIAKFAPIVHVNLAIPTQFINNQNILAVPYVAPTNNTKNTYGKLAAGILAASLATGTAYSVEQEKPTELDYCDMDMDYTIDATKYPEFAKFVKKYACPADFERRIKSEKSIQSFIIPLTDEESEQFKKIQDDCVSNYSKESITKLSEFMQNHKMYRFYYTKSRSIDRIINADRMRKIIAMHNLKHIGVPEKYICRMGNKWQVIAVGIPVNEHRKKLSLIEVQELAIILELTGINDLSGDNLLRDIHDKLWFIDTENDSFFHSFTDKNGKKETRCKVNNVRMLLNFSMEPEAQIWLKNRIKELQKSPDGFTEMKPLPFNTEYDDNHSFDVQQVYEELKTFLKEEPTKILAETGILRNGDLSMWGDSDSDNQKIRDVIMQAQKNGKRIDLRGTDLSGLDLSNMNLSDINFEGAIMNQTIFTNSIINRSNFSKIKQFCSADFTNVNTSQANFKSSNMRYLNGFNEEQS